MRYYHGSNKIIPVGTVLKPRKSSFVRSGSSTILTTEAIFEEARLRISPKALPRTKSVFMAGSASAVEITKVGGQTEAVFEVAPRGMVERNHTGWWNIVNGEIADMYDSGARYDEDAVELWADAYWRGEEAAVDNPLFARSRRQDAYMTFTSWEYRARSFEVIAEADSTVRFEGGRLHLGTRLAYLNLDEGRDLEGRGLARRDGPRGRCWSAGNDRSSLVAIERLIAEIEAEASPSPAY